MNADKLRRFAETKSSGGGANIRHGRYVFMIDRWFVKEGFKGTTDIHELVVVEAEKNVVFEDDRKVEVEPNPVGSKCSAAFSWDGGEAAKMGPVNSTQFLFALFGDLRDEDITPQQKMETFEECTNADPRKVFPSGHDQAGQPMPVNPCRGMLIRCETYATLTKTTKKWIAALRWSCYDPAGHGANTFEAARNRWAEYEARTGRSHVTNAA